MKLRQAKKIMKNVLSHSGMIWVYGSGRVNKANKRMCRYYSAGDESFKKFLQAIYKDPAVFLRAQGK